MCCSRFAAAFLFVTFALSTLLVPSASAQADISIQQGLNPYGSYMGGNIDTVSLTNGNLMLHIPLVCYPQRGGRLKLCFFLRYNNKGFHIRQWTWCCNGLGQQQTSSAWTFDGVGVDVARDQVTETRSVRGSYSAPQSGEKTNANFFLTLTSIVTADGSSHTVSATKSPTSSFAPGYIDGGALGYFGVIDTTGSTAVNTTSPGCPEGTSLSSFLPLISMDSNGNQITTTATGWTDTLGRQIPGESICTNSSPLYAGGAGAIIGIPATAYSWSFTTPSGSTFGDNVRMLAGVKTADLSSCPGNTVSARIWNLPAFNNSTATMKFCYANFQIATNFGVPSVPEVQGTYTFLQNVILPNGKMWTFNYNDNYGDLTSIGFPTGGSISYQWGTMQLTGGPLSRTITSRSVNANDGAGNHTWNYVWTPASSSNSFTVTLLLTDPAGNDSVHLSKGGFETEARYYQGSSSNSNNLLKTVDTTYQSFNNPFIEYTGGGGVPSFPASVTTTWPNGAAATVQKGYDTPTTYTSYDWLCLDCATNPFPMTNTRINGQLVSEELFDYGNGSTPIRTTATTYHTLDDPSTVITTDGNGNKCAETDFAYDDPNRLVTSGVTQQHGAPYTGAVRANLSSTTHWLSATPCSASASWSQITSHTSYFDTGSLASATDPLGNTTNYSYSPTFYGAYVTQTTLPPTGSTAHVVSGNYDFNTGLLTTYTDQNNQSRAYTYDNMWRLAQANFPDGGQSTFSRQETSFPFTATVTKKMSSSQSLIQTDVFDGLGRLTEAQLNSDPDCVSGDKTDTNYDGLGRVFSVSNPYCSTTDTTYGLTTYAYDALGRTIQVTHPDNSTVLTTYTGRATQVQDEGNGTQRVTRISQTDALGRLTSVCEVASAPFVGTGGTSTSSLIGQGSTGTPAACGQDIAGTGFLTSYQYDALDSLTQVNQSGIAARTFSYDSLSRLLSASNPESGSTTYTYDANSNLLTKTAPAPNQTGSATVTTCYGNWTGTSCDGTGYDALNRVTKKSYSDGTTPTVTFSYDTTNCPTCYPNLVGRLSQASVPGWSFLYGYDPTGRLLRKHLWMASPSGYLYHTFTYDLLGDIASETAGAGLAYYTYNTAARLTSVTSSYSDPNNPPNLISAMHYNAFGGLTSDTLGDAETETYSYVPKLTRLQSYTASYNNSPIYSFNITSFAPNGNVLAATDTANGNWNYSYDQFNRLVCADLASNGTCTMAPAGTPTYTYVYDRFGNRWQQNGPHAFIVSFTGNSSTNNNRMDGYSYDAAGNLMNDGTHQYTYDAENRITSVDNGSTATYAYDPDGNRVEKISSGSGEYGDPAGTWQFLYDQSGRQITRTEGTGWDGEVYAGSRHLATIGGGTYFNHADWLGTFRLQTIAQYINNPWYYTSCASLPFGDGLACKGVGSGNPTLNMRTTEIFTGKPRDFESGLDYFGARFDASSFGRFMSPDWSAAPMGVPYADFGNPQSLNLYSYVKNNPVTSTDPDGHCDWCQKLKNYLFYGVFVTNNNVEQALAQHPEQVQHMRDEIHRMTGIGYDQINKLSNKQVFDAAYRLRLEETENPYDPGNILRSAAPTFMTQWGWNDSPSYTKARKELEQGPNDTTHGTLNGKVPTREEATKMIEENGGTILRQDEAHAPGGVSTHTEPHINYRTSDGKFQTVIVKE